MKYLDALNEAKEASRQVVNGVAQCPKLKTGLIALVYGGDADDALPAVTVTADGDKDTDDSGLARFIPIAAGPRTVSAAVPEDRPLLIAPDPEQVNVILGQCPVVPLHMPTGVVPKITILWHHDNSAVPGAEVELVKSGAPKKTTVVDTGLADFGVRVRPYWYGVKVTFADGHKYLLFKDDFVADSVSVRKDQPATTFKIKRHQVKFHVVEQSGVNVRELVGAEVKLREPAITGTTALVEEKALTTLLVPVIAQNQETVCDVESLTPDTTDDMFEVVEVTSA